jgi:putative ABC transport system ATP-binding protein
MTMIRLDDVTKVYRTDRIETLALDAIDLTVEEGDFLAVMGPSGCGKTTLLNLMGLLDTPSNGTVSLDGAPIRTRKDRVLARIRNEKIGFVFQSFHLIPDLKVVDNVEIPLLYRRVSARERRHRAIDALEKVGLSSRVDHFPGQLSGGQQQRVAIARALVGAPRLILADEPTGNLDSAMGHEILSLLEQVNREARTTVVMVTHDPGMAERAHRTLRLYDGRQVA